MSEPDPIPAGRPGRSRLQPLEAWFVATKLSFAAGRRGIIEESFKHRQLMRTRTSYKEIKRRRMLKNVCGCVWQEIVLGGPPCVAATIIAAGFEEAQVLPQPLRFGH
ncbi:hypothetical protein U1Q18_051771, partial [Sarracenia purpurea var. burkii]